MLTFLAPMMGGPSLTRALVTFGLKPLKYFVDSVFRAKVRPVPGSVVYCDLWVMVEHSGIYIGEGRISNIVVDGIAESTVRTSDADDFTTKSMLGRQIYVSCDGDGAVGHNAAAQGAIHHLGERAFYGLVISNCHQFSERCVNYVDGEAEISFFDRMFSMIPGNIEPTIASLKTAARKKLGATKWRLWDWQSEGEGKVDDDGHRSLPEPDWQAHTDYFQNLALDAESIARIKAEMAGMSEYEAEIADEKIPDSIRQKLAAFHAGLTEVSNEYEKARSFLGACPDARFSYADLKSCGDDFSALAAQLQNNNHINELVHKMGREYISEERKKQARVPQASRSEVHGTHRSDDLMRVLPSELLNLEDENLEMVFYARLLEKNLLTYELQGSTFVNGEEIEITQKCTGPVVACLDTSGSMQGGPILKAKALLLAISNILKHEKRSLHVLLFGASGEVREHSMDQCNDAVGLLKFLNQGFVGGTDFETPLRRAMHIIAEHKDYKKADVLMISDGDCNLSKLFSAWIVSQKKLLDCSIYSVLCNGSRVEDLFSDEVVVL